MSKYLSFLFIISLIILTGCTLDECCAIDKAGTMPWPEAVLLGQDEEPEPVKEGVVAVEEEKSEPDPIVAETPEPVAELGCEIEGEELAIAGVPHELSCVVSNSGEVDFENYTLKIMLPEGLVFSDDEQSERIIDLEQLVVSDSNPIPFSVVAADSGEYTIKAEAAAENVDPASSDFTLQVKPRPIIKLQLGAPAQTNLEKKFDYTITLKNTSGLDLHDVVLQDKIDTQKLLYMIADPEGEWSEEKGILTWKFDELKAGEEKAFKVKVTAVQEGDVLNKARMKSRERVNQKAELTTRVKSFIGVRQDHYDTKDPVEVGETTTYVFEVANQGSKSALGISVTDMIPVESEFVEAGTEGVDSLVKYRIDGRKVIFDTIPELASGQSIKFKVTVRVTKVGSLLNTFEVTSQTFDKALKSQEGTTSYPSEESEVSEEATEELEEEVAEDATEELEEDATDELEDEVAEELEEEATDELEEETTDELEEDVTEELEEDATEDVTEELEEDITDELEEETSEEDELDGELEDELEEDLGDEEEIE